MSQPAEKILPTFRAFESSGGALIFRIPVKAFPFLQVYAYLVLINEMAVLIDTGSGFGNSNADLESGFDQASQALGRRISIEDLTHIFITHGHIDHFGGLPFLREKTKALVGIHELDLGILTNYEERVVLAEAKLKRYLVEAGVTEEQGQGILDMYRLNKPLFHSLKVDFTYQAVDMRVGPFEFLHAPGHCPGAVIIRLQDVLFSGDNVLGRITPHQSPEQLTLHTGLAHYLESLDRLEKWAGEPALTLAGHDDPILDLPGRIAEIRQGHVARLELVLSCLNEPKSIAEVSTSLFGEVSGYDTLLAIEEAGAHVEYLHQLGLISIVNFDQFERQAGAAAAMYQRVVDPVMEKVRLL
jgi:glyoxylase-like metal-dependent hydrolase (beta-lactamase superfamily II)